MASIKSVKITVELNEGQAWAYAQFLKRVGLSDYRNNAVDDNEAYVMLGAGEGIRDAFAKAGYAPR